MSRSQDFQWSGARILLHHIDPWAEYLRGDPNHEIYLQQNPNYLPVLYVLIAPLGSLKLETAKAAWIACNLFFAISSALLAARFYGLRGQTVVAIVCLELMATATRNTLGNGQQGLFVLWLWCVSLLHRRMTNGHAMVSGISYFKFNFAPATFLYLLLRRSGIRSVLMSLVPSLLATTMIWLWLTRGRDPREFLRLLAEPFQVSRTGYYPSGSDCNLMDVLQAGLLALHTPGAVVQVATLLTAVGVCAAVLYVAIHRHEESSVQWQMALMATLSFGLFRHHFYDAVVLLLPFCHAVRLRHDVRAKVVLGLIGFLWYAERLVDLFSPSQWIFVPQFAMLMGIVVMTYRLRTVEERVEPTWRSLANDAHMVLEPNSV